MILIIVSINTHCWPCKTQISSPLCWGLYFCYSQEQQQ